MNNDRGDEACERCGGSDFVEEGGRRVCAGCGLENMLSMITASDDWAEEIGRYQSNGGRLLRRRRKSSGKKEKKQVETRRIPNAQEALLALGHCFTALANALVDKCGAPENFRLHADAVWQQFAQKAHIALNESIDLPEAPEAKRAKVTAVIKKDIVTPREKPHVKITFQQKNPLQSPHMLLNSYHKPERNGGMDSGSKRVSCIPKASRNILTEALHTESLLPLLYLTIRAHGVLISAFDLERWSSFGSLPLMTLWRNGLNETDRQHFKDKPFFFAVVSVLPADTIAIAAEYRFAPLLNIKMQPVPFLGLASRFAHEYAPEAKEHTVRLARLATLAARYQSFTLLPSQKERYTLLGETAALAILCLALYRYYDLSTLSFTISPDPKAAAIPVDEDSCIIRNETEALTFFALADDILSPTAPFYRLAPHQTDKLTKAMEKSILALSPPTLNHTAPLVSIAFTTTKPCASPITNLDINKNLPTPDDKNNFHALITFFASDFLQCPASILNNEVMRLEASIDRLAADIEHPDLMLSLEEERQARILLKDDRHALYGALLNT